MSVGDSVETSISVHCGVRYLVETIDGRHWMAADVKIDGIDPMPADWADDEATASAWTSTSNSSLPIVIADMWGTTEIANDGGTWEGEWVGSIHSDGTHTTYETLTGTGDYEGFRYSYFTVSAEPGGEIAGKDAGMVGWIEPTDQT